MHLFSNFPLLLVDCPLCSFTASLWKVKSVIPLLPSYVHSTCWRTVLGARETKMAKMFSALSELIEKWGCVGD